MEVVIFQGFEERRQVVEERGGMRERPIFKPLS